MSMIEYVVRHQGGFWEVWLGNRLVGGYPTQLTALNVAEALAHAAAAHGTPAKILVSEVQGASIEFLAVAAAIPQAKISCDQG